MINICRAFACLVFCLPAITAAQPASPDAVVQNLNGKVVYLRSLYVENELTFDSQGNVTGTATPGPFSVSLIKIERVHLTGSALDITGHRGTLIPREATALTVFDFLKFREKIHIHIAVEPTHPEALQPLVNKVLATSFADALVGRTTEEQKSAMDSLPSLLPLGLTSPAQPPSPSTVAYGKKVDVMKPGAGVQSPKVLYAVGPDFTQKARDERTGGIVVLNLIVDRSGYPTHIRVRRTLNTGLDRNAIIAVSQYRFAPAIYQNQPVPVEVNIEVNFRIR